jgi:ribosomal-protein-alanine N-acetyltransferase
MKPTTRPIDTSFRALTLEDLEQTLKIESLCYEHPWSEAKFIDTINMHNSLSSVVVVDGKVVGYSLSNICVDYGDILNICIHPEYRRLGIGTLLMDYQIKQFKVSNINSILLEVRVSNYAAISYYEENRFIVIDKRKKYYNNGEDAIIMQQFI